MSNIPYYLTAPYYTDSLYLNDIYNTGMWNAWSIHDSSRDILSHNNHNTHHIIGSNWRTADGIRRSIHQHGDAIYNAVNRYGVMGINATNYMGMTNLMATNGAAARLNESIWRNGSDTRRAVYHNAHRTNDLIYHHNTESMNNHKTTQLEILKMQNELTKQNIDTKGVLGLQIARSEAALMLQNSNNFNELQKQASQNTAAIQLEAYKNQQALSMQIAKCECELKALLAQQANATNSQAIQQEITRLRETLNILNNENTFLRNNQ